MGLNTPMVVLNDYLHEIEHDPEFGKKVARAIQTQGWGDHRERQNSFSILPSSHSSTITIVAISGGMIRYVGHTRSHLETDQAAEVQRQRVDAVAKFLRETHGAGKNLTPWDVTPRSTKKKWIALAEGALRAADFGLSQEDTP